MKKISFVWFSKFPRGISLWEWNLKPIFLACPYKAPHALVGANAQNQDKFWLIDFKMARHRDISMIPSRAKGG